MKFSTKIGLISIILLVLCACNPNPTGQTTYQTHCGYLNEDCCVGEIYQDEWGMIRQDHWCHGDLECRADVCVEGPDYVSYERDEIY